MERRVLSLSSAETEFLSHMAARGSKGFTVDDARSYWNGDPNTARRLARLTEKGWLERLERGKYMIVPLDAGPDRQWSEDSYILATYLVDPAAISYWSAFRYWNLTEQVPRVTHVQTTSPIRDHRKTVLGMRFRFVKLQAKKFFGLKQEHLGGQRFFVTNPEKTVLDGLDRLELTGGIHEFVKGLLECANELDWDRIDSYLDRLGSGAVVKRLGFMVETLELDIPDRADRLSRWRGKVTAGISKLDPSRQREKGPIVTAWGLRVNVDERSLQAVP